MLQKALGLAVIPVFVLGCGSSAARDRPGPSDAGLDHDTHDASASDHEADDGSADNSLGPAASDELDDGVDNCQGSWEWTPGPALNVARRGARAVGLDASLLVMGGVTANGPTASVERLDDGAKAWKEVSAMPAPNAYFAAAATNGFVYVAGGYASGLQEVVAATLRYDVGNDSWEQLPNMPTARANAAAVFWNGRLIVAGGRTSVTPTLEITGAIEAYDPATGVWTTIAPGMPTPREGCSGIVEDGRLLLAGGSTSEVETSYGMDLVEYFSSEDLSWHAGAPLSVPRVSAAAGNPSGCAIVAGGWIFGAGRRE